MDTCARWRGCLHLPTSTSCGLAHDCEARSTQPIGTQREARGETHSPGAHPVKPPVSAQPRSRVCAGSTLALSLSPFKTLWALLSHLCIPSTALAACSPLESVTSRKKSSPSSTTPPLAIWCKLAAILLRVSDSGLQSLLG